MKDADSDDDFELIQCEEILISDDDGAESELETSSNTIPDSLPSKGKNKYDLPVKLPRVKVNSPRDPSKLEYVRKPTRPVRLFSFSDSDIMKKFSKTDETRKNLAMQLLDIVKNVNSHRKVKVENGTMVPNFYIMAAKCNMDDKQKVTEMDSSGIVNLVKDIVHMIKVGIYRKVDYVEVICDSPAIFLIKYIHVKDWDSTVNAVYVVTSEYLLPYLCKIRATEEEEEKAAERKRRSTASKTATRTETVKRRKQGSLSNSRKSKTGKMIETKMSTKMDEEKVEGILSKYLEPEAVQFFISQMKVAGKTHNQYRWKDDDKEFALNLLRRNPTEYCILFQKYALPSDKTLEKFVNKIRNSQEELIEKD